MDKLYSWEISHHLPSHWTPYDTSQPIGGEIALEYFISAHTQTQGTSSMARGKYQDNQKPQKSHWFQRFQKHRYSQLSNDSNNNNNSNNMNKDDTMPLCIFIIVQQVLSLFNAPNAAVGFYRLDIVDRLPSRRLNGFNNSVGSL
ncbi:hypothetical protein I312_101650 [Cryptococcus bacillisporus CA1280]|uniref:uncharacterized protein n=1 Tax=Cryptococcus bacillisporus CA1280 TaxID=1296109 RepID=UPI003369A09D